MKYKHEGSSFDEFLKEEGLFEEVSAAAVKRTIVMQLEERMVKLHKNKTAFRKALGSPTTAARLFSDHTGTALETLVRAAGVVDCEVVVSLRPRHHGLMASSKIGARPKAEVAKSAPRSKVVAAAKRYK